MTGGPVIMGHRPVSQDLKVIGVQYGRGALTDYGLGSDQVSLFSLCGMGYKDQQHVNEFGQKEALLYYMHGQRRLKRNYQTDMLLPCSLRLCICPPATAC